MIKGVFLFGTDDLDDVYKIRREVFHIEQGIDLVFEFDDLDQEAVHVLIKEDNENVATGRLVYDGHKYKIGRIAVLKDYRGKGYGGFVVRMLLDKAFEMGAYKVLVHSQEQVVPFYEGLGFRSVGDTFIEANISHVPMEISKDQLVGCQN
jgi:predicted GNAT family N-acyltransferase